MSVVCTIRDVPVSFPFEPYQIQKDYMEKVIECLQKRQHGVLESPTGTGKTLSLLCASLAWLQVKKAQIQAERLCFDESNTFITEIQAELEAKGGNPTNSRNLLGIPTIIYASRTHSQLTQAMQELKRTQYNYMKASVMGSREQMCIHPEIAKEPNHAFKIQMCRIKVKTRECHFYSRVEKMKSDPNILAQNVIDIEDIVKLGQSCKFCPYYMSKELRLHSDIVFMPYNYLLDPKTRKALGIELVNNIIILDEAHNVEKICEESASIQIKSTDLVLCIEEITSVMKALSQESESFQEIDVPPDFSADELIILKQLLLDFEREVDKIPLGSGSDGATFDGDYIYEMLQNAGISEVNYASISGVLDKLIQFLSTVLDGPFQRRGNALQLFSDFLLIVFSSVSDDFKKKIKKCYKVHIVEEEQKKKNNDNWLSKKTTKAGGRVLSFWCFSPGFGMKMLLSQGVHSIILTSGTLAPLKPLISELELNIGVQLENPHIVKSDQVCVKIVTKGPDETSLNCNFQNRNNAQYISSLGNTILNLTRLIPNGILIFFPSYPIMLRYQQFWQQKGIWGNINAIKTIFVEPQDKNSFLTAMNDYYAKIRDTNFKGAIFMGVCRGKISEGMDFADINGRAVFVIGLPYPPLKDPKIVLKKRYLNTCHSIDKQYLNGDDWYNLEASRAVNQAIGRVIRHQHDYGIIILLDSRYKNYRIRSQLSKWLQDRIQVVDNFGTLIRDMRPFFRNAEANFPQPTVKPEKSENFVTEFEKPQSYKQCCGSSCNSVTKADSSDGLKVLYRPDSSDGLKVLYRPEDFKCLHSPDDFKCIYGPDNKREGEGLENFAKKKKINLVPNATQQSSMETSTKEYICMVKKALDSNSFKKFNEAMANYRENMDFDQLKKYMNTIFLMKFNLRYIIRGLEPYIKSQHKEEFNKYCDIMN